jgi:hypothetical protein
VLTGEDGDIFNLCQYKWYDWCYFCKQKQRFPFNPEVLRQILGPAKGKGNKMAADHASDTARRQSRTGFFVYLNCAPVYWLSKKQTRCTSSSFGSEFVAMKECFKYLRGLQYKLQMMGTPCVGLTYIHGDKQSILASYGIPVSILKKKSQSIAYHVVREGAARDEWGTSYVNTNENEAHLLTKSLPSGEKRKGFIGKLLHHIFRA